MVLKLCFGVSKHLISTNECLNTSSFSGPHLAVHQEITTTLEKHYYFKYNHRNINQEEWTRERDFFKNRIAAKQSHRALTSFLPNGQSWGISSSINQQVWLLQYLLHSPWRPSILDFCSGEWRSGSIKLCSRTACCPLGQSLRPNGESVAVHCWV